MTQALASTGATFPLSANPTFLIGFGSSNSSLPSIKTSDLTVTDALVSTTGVSFPCTDIGSRQEVMAGLFDHYGRMVYSVALRVLKDSGQAEDVVQEVFFQLWRKPDEFKRDRGALHSWLAVLARNRAIDIVRSRKRTDSLEDVVLLSKMNLTSEIERTLLMERVRNVVKNMPPKQQNYLEWAYFEGLSHSEIAERTGDPLGTVKTRIRLALIGLRKALVA